MDLLSPEIWGIGESFHCFESNREWFLPGISVHALVAGVLGFKALKAILRIHRVCMKVGKESSCNVAVFMFLPEVAKSWE